MSQAECIEILKSHNRWMTTREIAKISMAQLGSTARALRILVYHKEITMKKKKIGNYNLNIYKIYNEG